MKRVVEVVKEEISINDINDDSIIGVAFPSKKVYVLEREGLFFGVGLLEQSLDSKWTARTKKEYASEALKQSGTEVFVFESKNEAIDWMVK